MFFPLKTYGSFVSNLSGLILLNVDRAGEAWYVYPEDEKRYFLGRPRDAFALMRQLGLGINEIDFQKIAQAGMPVEGDAKLSRQLSGKIIIQVEKNGEAWYVYPKDLKKYYLGRPSDAFEVMRKLSLGIGREDLAKIHKPGLSESVNQYSSYEYKKIDTKSGVYSVNIVEIDLSNPRLEIVTDTGNVSDCESQCRAVSLGGYVVSNDAFAGINGTYFEAYDAGKKNYYFYPVYNSLEKVLINEDQLKYWTTGPLFVWDVNNKFYYFKDSRDFGGTKEFEKKYNTKIQAAIGNRPRLIENGKNMLIEFDIDKNQRDLKARRNAIAYKNNKIYLVVSENTTVPDLADIMQEMGAEYALNLDGGSSSAFWYNDEYMIGPGRDVPNVIVFKERK